MTKLTEQEIERYTKSAEKKLADIRAENVAFRKKCGLKPLPSEEPLPPWREALDLMSQRKPIGTKLRAKLKAASVENRLKSIEQQLEELKESLKHNLRGQSRSLPA